MHVAPAQRRINPHHHGRRPLVSLVLPELKGKLDGFATTRSAPDGSMVDLTVELEKDATADEINATAMKDRRRCSTPDRHLAPAPCSG